MKILELPIEYYVDRLQRDDYFSMVGYSDAEWFCIIRQAIGNLTSLGQKLDANTGDKLLEILQRHQSDPRFLFAVPKCLYEWSEFVGTGVAYRIEAKLVQHNITCNFYERDMILDDLAAAAGLYPLIHRLCQMRTVVIGNPQLKGLKFLHYDYFIPISSPNFHLDSEGIKLAALTAKHYGKPAVYLVSAGISAALIIDQLHDQIPNSFFIDCGSIWDAFVGIGGQREWRKRLYENPRALEQWKHDNLYGKS